MCPWAERVFGISPEQVIACAINWKQVFSFEQP